MLKRPEISKKLKFQVLFENKLAAIFITQPDGSILDANSTAEKIIEDHGGQIWIDSEEGKGSVFHFSIKKSKKKYFS